MIEAPPGLETESDRSNPYVGPRALAAGEPIYGRDQELFELRNLLIAERIVLLYSPSAAGKTSLIQAGLVPELQREEFDVLPIMRVGKTPAPDAQNRYIASALSCLEEGLPAEVARIPEDELGALTLADYLNRRADLLRWKSTLLIFDQFEEILTTDPLDEESKTEFFRQVGAVLRDTGRWALFSLAEQCLAALGPYARLLPTRLKSTLRLELLSAKEAHEAIEKPAAAHGVQFTPEAAERLVADLREVTLPPRAGQPGEIRLARYIEPVQLQVVCFRLWEKPRSNPKSIGADEIAATGSVDSALADYYAEWMGRVAQASGVGEKTLREWFDTALITETGIRTEVMKGEGASAEINDAALEELKNAHLIRSEEYPTAIWLELAHDRLVRPVRTDNARWFEAHLSLLQHQAAAWQRRNRPDALCLRGEALREAKAWAEAHRAEMTKTDEEFLAASEKDERARSAQRNRRLFIAAIVVALVTSSLALVAWRQATIASARGLSSLAYRLFDERLDLAVLLAYEAWQKADLPETRSTVLAALLVNPRLTTFLHGHQSPVGALAFSPDGKLLAAGDFSSRIVLWDVEKRRPARALPKFFNDAVRAIAFSSDGKFMAACSKDGSIVLRDLAADAEVRFPTEQVHEGQIWSVAFSPDATLLASAGSDGKVVLWDVATRTPTPLLVEGGETRTVAFNASGSLLAAGFANGSVQIWEKQDGAWLPFDNYFASAASEADQRQRGNRITCVAFHPHDDNLLASGSRDWTVNLRDVAGRRNLAQGKHWGSLNSLAFSPAGNLLVSAAQDGMLRLWRVPARPLIPLLGLAAANAAEPEPPVAFPVRAERVAPLESIGRPLNGHVGWVLAVAFSPDGHTVASGGVDREAILWDTRHATPEGPNASDTTSAKFVLALSRDGRFIVTGHEDGRVIYRDATAGTEQIIANHPRAVRSVGFSPDGRFVISCSGAEQEGTAMVNDLSAPQSEPLRTDVPRRLTFAAISPDGKRAALAALRWRSSVVGFGEKRADRRTVNRFGRCLHLRGGVQPRRQTRRRRWQQSVHFHLGPRIRSAPSSQTSRRTQRLGPRGSLQPRRPDPRHCQRR